MALRTTLFLLTNLAVVTTIAVLLGSFVWGAAGSSPDRALVAVSSGILEGTPSAELEAVLGHELSHVGNGDMVTMTLLQGVVNAFVLFLARALWLLMPRSSDENGHTRAPSPLLVQPLEILLGLAGSLITAWYSRHRQYRADSGAAQLVGSEAMVGALERLGGAEPMLDRRDGPAIDTLKIAGFPAVLGLLASHPPLGERIRALQATPRTPATEPSGSRQLA